MTVTMQRREVERLFKTLRLIMLAVVVFGASGLGYVEKNRYEGCERGKKDRIANAASWTAHAKYINSVLLAASVKQDVKDAASMAQATYLMTSRDLTKRSRISCAPFGL